MSEEAEDKTELFDDQPTEKAEAEITTEVKDEGTDQKGDKESSPTPGEDEGTAESAAADTAEKMIPERRFKAALKDVTDKLELATQEITQLKAAPVPDSEADPEGYALHVRLEASKRVMREMKPDYQEIMTHYKKMADANPDLNVMVSKDPIPAKLAYDLAKADLEVKETREVRGSDDWKEFQEFKKSKAAKAEELESGKKANGMSKVPNLNRAANLSRGNSKSEDDGLFEGSL